MTHDMQNRIVQLLRGWDVLDAHRTGTPGDAQTAEWLVGQVETLGATPELDEFPFSRLTPVVNHLRLNSTHIDGFPCLDAPATGPRGISGRLVPYGQEGEIGLINFEANGPAANALIDARHATSHEALLAVCTGERIAPGLALINADAYGEPFGPPVLQLATEHRAGLESAAQAATRVTLTITMERELTAASNVSTLIPGRDSTLAPLVIMTPRSGWWHCTSERGGGLVAWFECLRHFTREWPARPVMFTANTGHELGHVGLDHYLETHPTLGRGAHCWVHLGANFAAKAGAVLYQASDQPLLDTGLAILNDAGQPPDATTPLGTRPFGEARNIFDAGGRYVSLLGGNPLFHHPDDRWPDAIDLDKTVRLTDATVRLVTALASADA